MLRRVGVVIIHKTALYPTIMLYKQKILKEDQTHRTIWQSVTKKL